MKVLVTGASGFIGSRVVKRLADGGHTIRCLMRKTSKTNRLDGVDYERAEGDIRDRPSLDAASIGVDAVIHLACISSWSDIRKFENELSQIAIEGTRNVIEAAKTAGAKRVVYVSSAAAVNASTRPRVFDEASRYELEGSNLTYSIVKHKAERAALSYKDQIEMVLVLPAEVYGPNDDAFVTAGSLRDVLKSWPTMACAGGTSIVHVDDVADGIVLALEKGKSGERYILGGDNLSIAELCARVTKLAGMDRRVFVLPNRVVRVLCKGMAKVGLPPPVPTDVLEYATRYWFMDSSKARRELGFSPRGADDTLRPVVDWLKAAGHV